MSKPTRFLPLLFLMLSGFWMVLFVTQLGVGLSEDSIIYLDSAESYLEGKGLTYELQSGVRNPLIIFPPGYPFAVLAVISFGVDTVVAARWLGAVFFAINIFLVALLLKRSTGKLGCLALLGAAFVLISPDLLYIHSMAWSEPPYFMFFLSVILLVDLYLEKQQRRFLILASVVCGAAFLTRYAAITLLIVAVATILWDKKPSWPRKIKDGALFGAVSCIPVVLWGIRNQMVTGGMTDREMYFHPISARNILPALKTFQLWLIPHDSYKLGILKYLLLALVTGSFIWWIVLLIKARSQRETAPKASVSSSIPFFTGCYIVFYLAFLIFWVSFFDADPTIGFRYLSPVYLCLIVFVLSSVHRIVSMAEHTRTLRLASSFFALAAVAWFALPHYFWVTKTQNRGLGYSRRIWRDSAILAKAVVLPPRIDIYTNAVAPVRIYDPERKVAYIPRKISTRTLASNAGYEEEMEKMHRQIQKCDAVLLWFNNRNFRQLTTDEELKHQLQLIHLQMEEDGTIYGVRECTDLADDKE